LVVQTLAGAHVTGNGRTFHGNGVLEVDEPYYRAISASPHDNVLGSEVPMIVSTLVDIE